MGCSSSSSTTTKSVIKNDDDTEDEEEIPLKHEEIMKQIKQDVNLIDIIINKFDPNKYQTLRDFIDYISRECSSRNLNDFSKAFLVYKWICLNIECDLEMENKIGNKNELPEKIYYRKKGPISNFATLFSYMINNLKIESKIVNGYVKGKEEKISWNIIKVYNASYFIETFMGSGNIVNNKWKKEFAPYFFCPNPEEFIFSHFPEVPRKDFIKYSLLPKNNICNSKREFDNLVIIKRNFFVKNFTEIIPKTFYLEADDLNRVQIIVKYNKNYNKEEEIVCHVGVEGTNEIFKKDMFSGINNEKDQMIIFNIPLIEKKEYLLNIYVKVENSKIKLISKQRIKIQYSLYNIKLLRPNINTIIQGDFIDFIFEINEKKSKQESLPYVSEKFLNNICINSFGKKCKLKKIRNYYEIKSLFILKQKIQICYYNKKSDNFNNIFKINAQERNDGNKVSFPEFFNLPDDMILIEPICEKLINNEKYNFKIKSNEISKIVIINNDTTIYVDKKNDGLYEVKDLEVKTKELRINYTKKGSEDFILAYKYKVE